jgi:formate hydrogenlyase transcriptional activator
VARRCPSVCSKVGDIPLELQPKLLRALQEREFERLGSTRTLRVDVRLIAATNRDLSQMVDVGSFRSDPFYRLNVFPVRVPPLRERREDIPALVRYFAQKFSRRLARGIITIPTGTMTALQGWDWPGNIRELENVIERAVILSPGPVLQVQMPEMAAQQIAPLPVASGSMTFADNERDLILRALRAANGTIGGPSGAASRLGMKRTTLHSKMKKLGIERPRY